MTDATQAIETLFTNIADTVNNRERNIRTAVWENGRDLVGVRNVLKKQGLWVQWQDRHLNISRQSVNNYIALYEAYPECQMILQDSITLSMLYTIARKPDPQLEIKAAIVQQKAHSGEKLTPADITVILDKNGVQKPEIRAAIYAANDVSPQVVRDVAISGALPDLDGNDVPIADIDTTLVDYNARFERRERIMRHIETETITLQYKGHSVKDGMLTVTFVAPAEVWSIVDYKAIVRRKPAPVRAEAEEAA